MQQYQIQYQRMIDENSAIFQKFFTIHEKYTSNPAKWQTEYNTCGGYVLDLVRKYERLLCGKTESSGFSKFSQNLSEKFWNLLRMDFPKIDCIGIQSSP